MTREEFLVTLLRFAAEDKNFNPDGCGFAVATEAGTKDSWFPFERGEIIVLEGDVHGREPFGEGRKPDKWSVAFEWFGQDLEAAKRRSVEVTGTLAS